MKIAYIGANDGLAEVLTERLVQEGNDVYLLSDQDLPQKPKGVSLHRFYRTPRKGRNFEKLLRSIVPDCVIFAGNHYISGASGEESDEDITLLARSLRAASAFPSAKFILLSSIDVYGNTAKGEADECAQLAADGERGVRFIREEQLLGTYQRRRGMDTVVLRASQLYTGRPGEDARDFLSRSFLAVVQGCERMTADMFQPLDVSDFADAIKRAIDTKQQRVYNVCGSAEMSAKHLHRLVCQHEKIQQQPIRWDDPSCVTRANSDRIRRELGWRDFHNLEEQLREGRIAYQRASVRAQTKKKRSFPTGARQLIENLIIFAVFSILCLLCSSHDLFSQINWLIIYVILISISYNIYQSVLAAILASGVYLFSRQLSAFDAGTFYFYASNVLTVTEFLFIGFIVGYTTNMLREDVRSIRLDLGMLQEEYEDLKEINDENVLIKNEYEERLLTSKSGFPRLYGLISRLMVQEPDRILMEAMQVISELVRTDTVAVYRGQEGSPWFRLLGALSDGSAMDGKTWNLSGAPHIYDAVVRGELYQGKLGSGEPAAVLPVVCRDVSVAVVLIKKLPYECETLYHINLLKTMSLLLRDSMEKALQYEELSRKDHYVEDSDVLKPEAFRERVLLAEEAAGRFVAEHCVVELAYSGSLIEAADIAGNVLRVTDCLGTDGKGKLFVLLNNTGPENLEHLQERLSVFGMRIRLISSELAESACDSPVSQIP